ncbi:Helix-turn-helix domain-containing protein [Halorientalis persicus]|jgi:predicted ArsR family transcriptional regulator|uniref:Helix-turn-helix domain-containing protein n=1 Tax=Halorientalis persicus TaxID=1367881 RepID=A0A1H8WBC4_9EURY|nr:helix-turn-helix domain-containing protein [Halorientalis persicus]SEP24936.1 Helix-turn-helix domain-containing protein [Halorientalis persicus]
MGDAEHREEGAERGIQLPEQSLLDLSDYLAMQRAIGNEHRFRILSVLVDEGSHSARELADTLDIASNTLHYHLDELVDVGLVENRKRTQPESDGVYSYYQATSLGEGILEHGVRELIREEWDLLDAYGG